MYPIKFTIECLKTGYMRINPVLKQLEVADGQLPIPYAKIRPNAWGYVYEKYVGQVLESEGFNVVYNGFSGYTDGGIDLIAEKDGNIVCIQCKYKKGKIGLNYIETLLNKASKLLLKEYQERKKQITFALVVQSIEQNFTAKAAKGMYNNSTNSNKEEYPLVEHLLNQSRREVKVELWERPMNI